MVRQVEPPRDEHVEREPTLLAEEHWVRAIVEGYFDGLTLAVDGRIIACNDTFARMFGYEIAELIGKTPLDLATPESAREVLSRIRAGNEAPYEAVGVHKDGHTFACEIVGRNVDFRGQKARVTSFRDVTERRALENEQQRMREQVLHAQRLENLGVLAGGIAHDFNNLLQVIVGAIDLARLVMPAAPETAAARGVLDEAMEAAARAAELSRQMLAYSGRTTLLVSRCDLGALAREAAELVRSSHGAEIVVTLGPDVPSIEGDPAQLRQVISNLLVNAAESGEGPGPVRLTTGEARLATTELAALRVNTTPGPGDYAFVEVRDQGRGMDLETLDRIFDPFFTTKAAGRGLGLASVLGIARSHHAGIDVVSEPGHGSRFRVYFPIQTRRTSESSELGKRPPSLLSGRILLADDEKNLRSVLRQGLASFGLDVVEAEDGQRALELFHADPGRFDLLVLDMTMPGLGGALVLDEVRKARPGIPVILASGYTDYELDPQSRAAHTAFLPKPFHLTDLVELVRVMLEDAR